MTMKSADDTTSSNSRFFTPDGYINENAPEKYVGLSRWECRKRIVEDLQDLDYLVKIVPHRHAVGHHDRCGAVVEPAISPQWFMNVRPLAQRAIEATKKGDVKFVPERETARFYHWMENIEPWPHLTSTVVGASASNMVL